MESNLIPVDQVFKVLLDPLQNYFSYYESIKAQRITNQKSSRSL